MIPCYGHFLSDRTFWHMSAAIDRASEDLKSGERSRLIRGTLFGFFVVLWLFMPVLIADYLWWRVWFWRFKDGREQTWANFFFPAKVIVWKRRRWPR